MITVWLCDNVDNCQYYSTSQLEAAGFRSTIIIADTNSDTTPPRLLSSLSFTQSGTTFLSDILVYPEAPIIVDLQTADDSTGASSGVGFDGYSGCNPFMWITSQNQFPSDSNKNSTQTQYASLQQFRPLLA